MIEILSSVDFWKFSAPLFGAILAWFLNEWRKRIWEQYQRKEESYKELIRCLKGFYVGVPNSQELKSEFLNKLNKCWLYCPDEVILNGYAFLDTVHASNTQTIKRKKMQWVSLLRPSGKIYFHENSLEKHLYVAKISNIWGLSE